MQVLAYFLAAVVCICIEPTYISLITRVFGDSCETIYTYNKRKEINTHAISGVLPVCVVLIISGLAYSTLTLLHRMSPFSSLFLYASRCAPVKFNHNCVLQLLHMYHKSINVLRQEGPYERLDRRSIFLDWCALWDFLDSLSFSLFIFF